MHEANRKIARDYGVAVGAAVAVALLIRVFAFEAYRIPTAAMHPTLEPGDTIFVAKSPLGFSRSDIARGDVIVFENPLDPGHDYIKRVLALAGETVQVRQGRLKVNGKAYPIVAASPKEVCGTESAISDGGSARSYTVCWDPPILEDFGPEKVPERSVFVLGDSRTQSAADAKKRRLWGMIPVDAIKGRAKWIWLSVEPQTPGISGIRFPHLRFERMFRRVE